MGVRPGSASTRSRRSHSTISCPERRWSRSGPPVSAFGTAGCNLTCKFCQNYDVSKAREIDRLNQDATPVMIADAARQLGCRSVAFTYNDPVIFLEYAVDTARACHEAGLKTVAVTAGYITPEARGEIYADID